MLPKNDPWSLQQDYKTAEKWRVRVETHERYSEPKVNFVEWVLKLINLKGDEVLLDVGCGPGKYYESLRAKFPDLKYYGMDYSTGMMTGHEAEGWLTRGTMSQIPFPDNTFDVLMANHVLYLAPNVDEAVQEMRRVLKPDGIFVAATNSMQTMPQFRELFRRAILLVSPPGTSRDVKVPNPMHNRFALENGTRILSRHYFAVVRHDLPGAFVFDNVEPIMEYLESIRSTREPQLPPTISWEQVMLIMREQCTNLIATLDTLVVDKLTGVLIATNGGGFIEEYLAVRNGSGKSSTNEGESA